MDKISRLLMAAASLVLTGVFFLPLWQVKLIAPQYPEGLRMIIWLTKITGGGTDDLYNIDLLNQYIGMQSIDPSSIPELKIMPVFIGIMVALGLLAAFSKVKVLPIAWVSVLMLSGIVCFVDFYRFEYNYGHHLNPDAPIKVPGMSYQPPLVGTKQFLNMTASSLPQSGFLVGGLAIALGAASVLRMRCFARRAVTNKHLSVIMLIGLMTLSLTSCGHAGPIPISYGKDVCTFCNMTIIEKPYWAELVTGKGKVYKFDSINCLSSYILQMRDDNQQTNKLWVADFSKPDNGINAASAFYLYNPKLSGPMGQSIAAFKTLDCLAKFKTLNSSIKSWADVTTQVKTKWLQAEL